MEDDERFYEVAAKELTESPRQGLLIKCGVECNGDEKQAKLHYINIRVAQMRDARMAEEERRIQSYGGPEVLAKIKAAKESGAAVLNLPGNKISDVSPLKGLTNLKWLSLWDNQISDLSPLAGLTKLETLYLTYNRIPEDQKAMIKKALPNCVIDF